MLKTCRGFIFAADATRPDPRAWRQHRNIRVSTCRQVVGELLRLLSRCRCQTCPTRADTNMIHEKAHHNTSDGLKSRSRMCVLVISGFSQQLNGLHVACSLGLLKPSRSTPLRRALTTPPDLGPMRTHDRTHRDIEALPVQPRTNKSNIACACNADTNDNEHASRRGGWDDEEMDSSPEVRRSEATHLKPTHCIHCVSKRLVYM